MDNGVPLPQSTYRKKKRRSRKKKKQQPEENKKMNQDSVNSDEEDSKGHKNVLKKKKHKRRHSDRYFGRFSCSECKRNWDSAHVYTIAGTKKVKYKQACKNHPDIWVFPYRLDILECSQCKFIPCQCLCEDCGKLKHVRYTGDKADNKDGKRIVDNSYEYCKCKKEKKKKFCVGDNIDLKKHHIPQLCQKCMKGRPCSFQTSNRDETFDNEP